MSAPITLNPVELPEIRALIAQYLSKYDLAQCVRASQSWNALFLPYIWDQVILDQKTVERGFNLESLEPHSHLVKSISVTDTLKFGSLIAVCTNLKSLQLRMSFGLLKGFQQTLKHQLEAVLTPNISIVCLDLDTVHVDWAVIAGLKNLRELKLTNCETMIGSSPADFWNQDDIKLEALSLTFVNIPGLWEQSTGKYPIFQNIKALEIERMTKLPESIQVEIVRQCPNIETLRFRPNIQSSITMIMVRLAAAGSWPKLRSLFYDGPKISDQGVVDILTSMDQCDQWDVSYADFTPLSFQALNNHFSTLTRVNLAYCWSVTSKMLQEVLSSCPLLRKFRGPTIHARDIVEGDPWVCSSLQTFVAFIDFGSQDGTTGTSGGDGMELEHSDISAKAMLENSDTNEFQRLVYEQISQLRRLKILLIGVEPSLTEDVQNHRHGLELKLGKGLELLSSLKELEIFGFNGTTQNMELEEVKWMITHWRRLGQIMGTYCHNGREKDFLEVFNISSS
ncbi:hypothetical protein BGX27_000653 [Mortierella sp. AM989]|nr:hypothetical protein BGX27_000653 [Mortierella sp. AM989]